MSRTYRRVEKTKPRHKNAIPYNRIQYKADSNWSKENN